nr:RtcB family protein [Bacillota bacterium]
MSSLERVGQNCYRLPKRGSMLVEARVYLNDELYRHFKVEEDALKQLMDAASLRGVYGPVVGMPDIHAGFGLPLGGVMA